MNRLLPLCLTFSILVGGFAIAREASAFDALLLVTCEADRNVGWVVTNTTIGTTPTDAGAGFNPVPAEERCGEFLRILLDDESVVHGLSVCVITSSAGVRTKLVHTVECTRD